MRFSSRGVSVFVTASKELASPSSSASPLAVGQTADLRLKVMLRRCHPVMVLFILSLMMPTYTSFLLGSFRLTGYRVLLILFIVPSIWGMFSGRYRALPSDWMVLTGILWGAMTLLYHHGTGDGLEAAGILIVESLGPYFLARSLIRNELDYRSFVALLVVITVALLPLVMVESFTGQNLFGQARMNMEPRLGLRRARGPFDHPIVFGVFVASVLGMAWFCFPSTEKPVRAARLVRSAAIFAATVTSVSSGALVAAIIQILLTAWNYLTHGMKRRWRLLLYLLALAYTVVNILSTRTPMRVFLTYLTFSKHTAYNRLTIWEWGFYKNVLENPLFGIGLNVWIRPSWMHSTSMDNFWLVLMVRHGLPCFLLLATGGILLMFRGAKRAGGAGLGVLQKGWTITMIGIIVAASTVHLWNALFAYFFFLLGAGAWFCSIPDQKKG